jgi:glycosyltransferase involved in cell wall biosynthesis
MKIAFDGTVLHGRKSGVGYYCEELLKALLATNHSDQFFVFSHQPVSWNGASNGNLKFTNSVHCPVRAFYLHALLPKILDQIQPDLSHYTNFLVPIFDDRPYVVTVHDMSLETLRSAHPLAKRLYTRRLVPRAARNARLILTNSEYSKWEIVRYLSIPEDRIRVTPLAPSPEFKPTRVQHEGNPYFLYVGNLEPRKNLERLIDAFARMPSKEHDLIIAGNRWYRGDSAEQKARSLGLNGRVKFLGYVPRGELPALFSGATAFVYPSLLEGFGLPVVEAMACGTPVITSKNSSMKEVAGDAALLIDPRNVLEMTEALAQLSEDAGARQELSRKGLNRATQFSWHRTAKLTLDAYREALESSPRMVPATPPSQESLAAAILKTVEHSRIFQYPLTPEELRERLFGVKAGESAFRAALDSLRLQPDDDLIRLRAAREKTSDEAIRAVTPQLVTLVSLPFVRMLAFSGATAHRNMSGREDIDLFMIVEDGKLWAVFLLFMIWAKLKGLRRQLCINYVISDTALPLFEHDAFTAEQVISLKPIYGKSVYNRFISMNRFIYRCFPNFEPSRNRNFYPELKPKARKWALEAVLRLGPVQILERISRSILGRYLARKITPESDVQLDPRRLKLHLLSHKKEILKRLDGAAGAVCESVNELESRVSGVRS